MTLEAPERLDITSRGKDRFDSKWTGEPNSGCWLWVASVMSDGYGQINVNRRPVAAHRFSWQLHRGPIPPGLWVLHRCDVRSCVNPDHLFLGTRADNSSDMVAKARQVHGERHNRAKLTDDQVRTIRKDRRPYRMISADFGVGRPVISEIKSGKIWRHVD